MIKPVVTCWYYDGYYEDFSWEKEYKDVSVFLKDSNLTIEQLNTEIQKLKKQDSSYDIATDSVVYKGLRVSNAFVDYPEITAEMLLQFMCLIPIELNCLTVIEIENKVLQELIKHPELEDKIRLIVKGE